MSKIKQNKNSDKIPDDPSYLDGKRSVNYGIEQETDGYQSVNQESEKKTNLKNEPAKKKKSFSLFDIFKRKSQDSTKRREILVEKERNQNPYNFSLENEDADEKDSRESTRKGKKVPVAKFDRDPDMDLAPIEEKDLGLPEESFLLDRKVTRKDMALQMEVQEKFFLGGNVRKPREFVNIFDKGKSSPMHPKIDFFQDIDMNLGLKKELIAQQMLRNYESTYQRESKNAKIIFKELDLLKDEEFSEKLKDDDESLHENEELIKKVKDNLPSI